MLPGFALSVVSMGAALPAANHDSCLIQLRQAHTMPTRAVLATKHHRKWLDVATGFYERGTQSYRKFHTLACLR